MSHTYPQYPFILTNFIYNNLDLLHQYRIISQHSHCGPNAIEYISYRVHGSTATVLEDIFEKLELSPVGDIKFKAEVMLQRLVDHINDNTEDGIYFVNLSDGEDHQRYPGKEVTSHVFVIEKVGDQYCINQTHINIGNRQVCGIPICAVDKYEIVTRLQSITNLLTSDNDVIEWTVDQWNSWLSNLGVPLTTPPKDLNIYHRRALWVFIPMKGTRGSLFNLKTLIERRIPEPGLPFITDYSRYDDLKKLDNYIDRISEGTDWLDDTSTENESMTNIIDLELSNEFFNVL